VSGFARGLRSVRVEWVARLTELVLSAGTIESARQINRISELQAQVREQLTVIGYDRLAESFVNSSYAGTFADAADAVAAAGVTAIDTALAVAPQAALGVLRALDLVELGAIGARTVQTITAGVVRNAIAGTSRRKIIADIQADAGRFQAYAATYADTALSVFDRAVHEAAFKGAGIDRFLYMGPRDIKNRPFCALHAGKVYTAAQVGKLNNGTKLMPVSKYGGGWNCRHILIPFFE